MTKIILYLPNCYMSDSKTDFISLHIAGYCVITYLLGIGDRHLDNLLLTKSGKISCIIHTLVRGYTTFMHAYMKQCFNYELCTTRKA